MSGLVYSVDPGLAQGLRFAFEIRAEIAPPLSFERNRAALRVCTPVIGGHIIGDRIRATIQNRVGDCSTNRHGIFQLDARYFALINDGTMIEVRNVGIEHGGDELFALVARGHVVSLDKTYSRTCPTFRTDDPNYDWLTK